MIRNWRCSCPSVREVKLEFLLRTVSSSLAASSAHACSAGVPNPVLNQSMNLHEARVRHRGSPRCANHVGRQFYTPVRPCSLSEDQRRTLLVLHHKQLLSMPHAHRVYERSALWYDIRKSRGPGHIPIQFTSYHINHRVPILISFRFNFCQRQRNERFHHVIARQWRLAARN